MITYYQLKKNRDVPKLDRNWAKICQNWQKIGIMCIMKQKIQNKI